MDAIRPLPHETGAGADELCAFARQHIADYKAPEEIHFRAQLPKNPVGKIRRRALKESLAGR